MQDRINSQDQKVTASLHKPTNKHHSWKTLGSVGLQKVIRNSVQALTYLARTITAGYVTT